MEYALAAAFSAFFFGKTVWGWWLKFVFNRASLRFHPELHVPIIEEPVDTLLVVMLARMRALHAWLSVVLAALASMDAATLPVSVAAGFGASVLFLLPFVTWFFQATRGGSKPVFAFMATTFGKGAFSGI